MKLEKNVIRAILLFLLGGLGSYIINNSDYKLEGYQFRTGYIFLIDAFTGGLFSNIVALAGCVGYLVFSFMGGTAANSPIAVQKCILCSTVVVAALGVGFIACMRASAGSKASTVLCTRVTPSRSFGSWRPRRRYGSTRPSSACGLTALRILPTAAF